MGSKVLVRVDVTFIGNDDTGGDGQGVGSVVPLLTGGGHRVLGRDENFELVDTQGLGDDAVHVLGGVARDADLLVSVWAQRERRQLPQAAVNGERTDVDHGHHRVQVHLSPCPVHLNGDDLIHLASGEEPAGEPLDALRGGAL